MSAIGSQRRKIAKNYKDRMRQIHAAYKLDEWLKHKTNARDLLISIRQDQHDAEDRELARQKG